MKTIPADLSYEEIALNHTEQFCVTVTEKMVQAFAQLSGDVNDLHLNSEYAQTTQFRGKIVHGMLLAGFFSTLVGMYIPGRRCLYISQEIHFSRPVRENETVTVEGVVTGKSDRERLLTIRTRIYNASGEIVVDGRARALVMEPRKKKSNEYNGGDMDLSGKTILISGASRGIGAAVACRLAACGAGVCINYNKSESAAEGVAAFIQNQGGKAVLCRGDISSENEVDAVIEQCEKTLGMPDVFIHNAAPSVSYKKPDQITWKEYLRMLDVILKGACLPMEKLLPHMKEKKSGSFLAILSSAVIGSPAVSNLGADYVTAKSALLGFMKSLAVEMGPFGIRANGISPSMVNTDYVAHIPDRLKSVIASQNPMKRMAEGEDVASVAAFLISDDAKFINGVNIPVTGGSVLY